MIDRETERLKTRIEDLITKFNERTGKTVLISQVWYDELGNPNLIMEVQD